MRIAPSLRPAARLVTLLLAVAAAAAAQSPAAPPADGSLETVPLTVEALGLSWRLPAGSVVRTEKVGERLSVVVEDPLVPPAWSVRVLPMTSTLAEPSAAAQIDDHLRRLRDSGENIEVLTNTPRRVAGADAHLCYLRQVGLDGQALIRGWLIIPRSERDFLVLVIVALPAQWTTLPDLLEKSFQTISLRSPESVAGERNLRIERGRTFLAGLTPERLQALCDHTQWSRIYRPRPGGADEEIGYGLVEVFAGKRGLLNPEKPESRYSAAEHETGFVVRIRGRLVGDAQREIYFDSDAIYWLAWDQSEEAWSVRGTQRQREAARSESETGLRTAPTTGSPLPRLTVIQSRAATNERDPYEWNVPTVYLSQALGWAVGRLLPRAGAESIELSYYAYNARGDEPRLTVRTDHWAPAADGSGDWILTTRMGSDGTTYRTIYRADGSLRRVMLGDGSVSEPADLRQLQQIWGSRGMPMNR